MSSNTCKYTLWFYTSVFVAPFSPFPYNDPGSVVADRSSLVEVSHVFSSSFCTFTFPPSSFNAIFHCAQNLHQHLDLVRLQASVNVVGKYTCLCVFQTTDFSAQNVLGWDRGVFF